MRRIDDVLSEVGRLASRDELEDFIARGWVRPMRDETDYMFDDMDVARVQLVCELHIEMKFEIDAVDLILSLMDQLYESRARFDQIVKALENQPDEVYRSVIKNMKESSGSQ